MMTERWGDEETRRRGDKIPASPCLPVSPSQSCPACGAKISREDAKYCRVCGKLLKEGFQPLDNLRASYHLQGKTFQDENRQAEETINLFETNKNGASESAKALIVYSLVPYLGILFCPFALLTGGFGAFVAYRNPRLGGGRTSFYAVILSFVIFLAQMLLWWLLYLVPELGKSI